MRSDALSNWVYATEDDLDVRSIENDEMNMHEMLGAVK